MQQPDLIGHGIQRVAKGQLQVQYVLRPEHLKEEGRRKKEKREKEEGDTYIHFVRKDVIV
jgi:hypothetical protein